jgi:hypothetical protein
MNVISKGFGAAVSRDALLPALGFRCGSHVRVVLQRLASILQTGGAIISSKNRYRRWLASRKRRQRPLKSSPSLDINLRLDLTSELKGVMTARSIIDDLVCSREFEVR